MRTFQKKGLLVMAIVCLLMNLFGCVNNIDLLHSKPEFPFDTTKAYCYHRKGVIAGGNCNISVEPQGVVKYYSYPEYPSGYESGMKDKGADIYFVGLKEGKVKVTLEYSFPTTTASVDVFILEVDKELNVSKC